MALRIDAIKIYNDFMDQLQDRDMTFIRAEPVHNKNDILERHRQTTESARNLKLYPHPPLHLGQLIHTTIQEQLDPNPNPGFFSLIDTTTPFISHLNSIQPGLGNTIQEKFELISSDCVIPDLLQAIDTNPDRNIYWLAELNFVPSKRQIKVITQAQKDASFADYLHNIGFNSLGQLAKEVLTKPDLTRKLQEESKELRSTSNHAKLISFIQSIQTYNYFDFSLLKQSLKAGTELDISAIPERYRRIVISASARPDLVTFGIKADDPAAKELVTWFKENRRQLLDMSSFTTSEKQKAFEMLEYIREGRIKFNLVEIKSRFIKPNASQEILKSDISDAHYKYISHTLWAMYQFLSGIHKMADTNTNTDSSWKNDMYEFNTEKDPKERVVKLLRLVRNLRPYVDPEIADNKVILARVHVPLLTVRHLDGKAHFSYDKDIQRVRASKVTHQVNILEPRKLIRNVASTGYRLVQSITGNI